MEDFELPGSLIGHVMASLVERVTALEQNRRPRLRPTINDEIDDIAPRITKAAIDAEMIRLFVGEKLSPQQIAGLMGYTHKTVRNHLKKCGVYAALKGQTHETIDPVSDADGGDPCALADGAARPDAADDVP